MTYQYVGFALGLLFGAAGMVVMFVEYERDRKAWRTEADSLYAAGIFLAKQNAVLRNAVSPERVEILVLAERLADPETIVFGVPEQRKPHDDWDRDVIGLDGESS